MTDKQTNKFKIKINKNSHTFETFAKLYLLPLPSLHKTWNKTETTSILDCCHPLYLYNATIFKHKIKCKNAKENYISLDQIKLFCFSCSYFKY